MSGFFRKFVAYLVIFSHVFSTTAIACQPVREFQEQDFKFPSIPLNQGIHESDEEYDHRLSLNHLLSGMVALSEENAEKGKAFQDHLDLVFFLKELSDVDAEDQRIFERLGSAYGLSSFDLIQEKRSILKREAQDFQKSLSQFTLDSLTGSDRATLKIEVSFEEKEGQDAYTFHASRANAHEKAFQMLLKRTFTFDESQKTGLFFVPVEDFNEESQGRIEIHQDEKATFEFLGYSSPNDGPIKGNLSGMDLHLTITPDGVVALDTLLTDDNVFVTLKNAKQKNKLITHNINSEGVVAFEKACWVQNLGRVFGKEGLAFKDVKGVQNERLEDETPTLESDGTVGFQNVAEVNNRGGQIGGNKTGFLFQDRRTILQNKEGIITSHKKTLIHSTGHLHLQKGEIKSEKDVSLFGRRGLKQGSQVSAKSLIALGSEETYQSLEDSSVESQENLTVTAKALTLLTPLKAQNQTQYFLERDFKGPQNFLSSKGRVRLFFGDAVHEDLQIKEPLVAEKGLRIDGKNRNFILDGKMSPNASMVSQGPITLKTKSLDLLNRGLIATKEKLTLAMKHFRALKSLLIGGSFEGEVETFKTIASNLSVLEDAHLKTHLFHQEVDIKTQRAVQNHGVSETFLDLIPKELQGLFEKKVEVEVQAAQSALLNVGGSLSLEADTFTNRGGLVRSYQDMVIECEGEILNESHIEDGHIIAMGALTLKGLNVTNKSRMGGKKALRVEAERAILNEGGFETHGSATFIAGTKFDNPKGSEVRAGLDLTIEAPDIINFSARMEAARDMRFVGNNFENTREPHQSVRNGDYITKSFPSNSGQISAGRDIHFHISNNARNYASQIMSGRNIHQHGHSVHNEAVTLYNQHYYCYKKDTNFWGSVTGRHYRWANTTAQTYPAALTPLGDINLTLTGDFLNSGFVEADGFILHSRNLLNGLFGNQEAGPNVAPAAYIPLAMKPEDFDLRFFKRDDQDPKYLIRRRNLFGGKQIGPIETLLEQGIPDNRPILMFHYLGDHDVMNRALQREALRQTGRIYFDRASMRDGVNFSEVMLKDTLQTLKELKRKTLFEDFMMQRPFDEENRNLLDRPILWPRMVEEKKKEEGGDEKIITYLTFDVIVPDHAKRRLTYKAAGELKGNKAKIRAKKRAHNTGFIDLKEELDVECEDFINEKRTVQKKETKKTSAGLFGKDKYEDVIYNVAQDGGEVNAGSIRIKAIKDILNKGGKIVAEDDVDLNAGGDVINTTQVNQHIVTWDAGRLAHLKGGVKEYAVATHFIPGEIVSKKGRVNIFAGHYAKNIGSLIKAKDDLIIKAQKLVREDVSHSVHLSGNTLKFNGIGFKSEKKHTHVLHRAESLSTHGNVVFVAHEGDVEIRGSSVMAALKITLKGEDVKIEPFIAQVEETVERGGVEGLGVHHKKVRKDNTVIANAQLIGKDIEIEAENDINIRATLMHALDEISLKAGRDIHITPELIQHYIKSESFGAHLNFFGSKMIEGLIEQDINQATRALLHDFPMVDEIEDLLDSEDAADYVGNGTQALISAYKTLKGIKQAGSLAQYVANKMECDPKVRFGAEYTNQYWTEALTTWIHATTLKMIAGRNIVAKGLQGEMDHLKVKAQNATFKSAVETLRSEKATAGITVGVLSPSLGVDGSRSDLSESHHIFTHLKVKENATFEIKENLNLIGALIEAGSAFVKAKSFKGEAVQDRIKSTQTSASASISGSSASFSASHQERFANWVSEKTGLHVKETLWMDISDATSLKGAFIGVEDEATPLSVVGKNNGDEEKFYVHALPNDEGQSLFYGMYLTRAQAATSLFENSQNEIVRSLAAPEIAQALIQNKLPPEMQDGTTKTFRFLYQENPNDFNLRAIEDWSKRKEIYESFILHFIKNPVVGSLKYYALGSLKGDRDETSFIDAIAHIHQLALTLYHSDPQGALTPQKSYLPEIFDEEELTEVHLLQKEDGSYAGLSKKPGKVKSPIFRYEDVQGEDHSEGYAIGLNLPGFKGPTCALLGVLDGEYEAQDRKQHNRATVTSNIQIVTESNVEDLNRDLKRAQEIEDETGIHIRVVVPIVRDWKEVLDDIKGGVDVLKNTPQEIKSLFGIEKGEDLEEEEEGHPPAKVVNEKEEERDDDPLGLKEAIKAELAFIESRVTALRQALEEKLEEILVRLDLQAKTAQIRYYAADIIKSVGTAYTSFREECREEISQAWNQALGYVEELFKSNATAFVKEVQGEGQLRPAALPLAAPAVPAIASFATATVAQISATINVLGAGLLYLYHEHVSNDKKEKAQEKKEAVNAQKKAGAQSTPMPPDWGDDEDPEDHEGDRWQRNEDGRWHNERAADKKGIPNRPNFENQELRDIADELYRPKNTHPGGSAGMLRKEVSQGGARHLIKCEQRIRGLRRILTDPKIRLSRLDRKAAERLLHDLREAVKMARGGK